MAIAYAVLKVAALVVFTMVVGGGTIPWLLAQICDASRELFTLAVLVTALGIAVASAEIFGVSMALGAFLAGLFVGRSEFSVQRRQTRCRCAMHSPCCSSCQSGCSSIPEPGRGPLIIAATLAVVLIGKPLAALAISRFSGTR